MTLQISNRLKMIANEISEGAFFADIGSDHAYLPCYVCLHDQKARAIAGEVAKGPYIHALNTVKKNQLNDRIEVRLGDGLQVIDENELVEEIVIAGMGGNLISKILLDGKEKLHNVKKLILQPNNKEPNVRKTLIALNFILTKEIIMEENQLIYEILVAEHKNLSRKNDPYDLHFREKQLLFGPYLLEEKSPIFIKKWTEERKNLERTILQMKHSKTEKVQQKIEQFSKIIEWIEEAI